MTEISGGYVNHAGSTRDSEGGIYAIFTQDGPNSGDVDVIVKRCAPNADPSIAASWEQVYRFTEAGFGKHGYGTGEVRNDGAFVAILAERNAANETVTRIHVIPGLCPPRTPAAPAASGALWQPDGGPVQVFARAPFEGEATIDLDAHGVPPCALLSLEVVVSGVEQRGGSVNGVACYVQSGGRATITPTLPPGPGNTLTVRSIGAGGLGEFLVKIIAGW